MMVRSASFDIRTTDLPAEVSLPSSFTLSFGFSILLLLGSWLCPLALASSSFLLYSSPVSYTHLDVYKRQILLCSSCFCFNCSCFITSCRNFFHSPSILDRVRFRSIWLTLMRCVPSMRKYPCRTLGFPSWSCW